MLNFILKRSLLALPTLFLVSLMVFLLVRMIPGDPASVLLGEGADAASIAAINARLGLDQPLPKHVAKHRDQIDRALIMRNVRVRKRSLR